MPKSKLITIGVYAVLTFGLAACAPDKKSDSWSVDAPQIALKAGSQLGFTDKADREQVDRDWTPSLREMSNRVLPTTADIVFPSLEGADRAVAPFDVTMISSCAYGDLTASEQTILHNVARFSLLTVIPKRLMVTALSEARSYTCSLQLSVSNQLGSAETFSIPSLRVQNLDDVSGVSLQRFDNHQILNDSVPTITYDDAHRYILDQTNDSAGAVVQLTCDLHAQAKTYSDLNEFHLDDLLPAADPKNATWKQTCRIIVTPNGHPENLQISKRFVLAKTTPALKITRNGINCAEFLNRRVMSFKVTNDSDQTQIVGLHVPNRIHGAEGILQGQTTIYLDAGLHASIAGATKVDARGKIWFNLDPGETKNIEIMADQNFESHACPGDPQLVVFDTTDETGLWVGDHPELAPAGLDAVFAATWGHPSQVTIEQTGHFKNFADVTSLQEIGSDVSTALPLTTAPTARTLLNYALGMNKQSAY